MCNGCRNPGELVGGEASPCPPQKVGRGPESDLSPLPEHLFCPGLQWVRWGPLPLGRADSHQFKCSSYPKTPSKVPPEWCLTSYPVALIPDSHPHGPAMSTHHKITIKTWMVVLFCQVLMNKHSCLVSSDNNPSTLTPFYVLRPGAHQVSRTFLPSPSNPGCWVFKWQKLFFSSPLRISTTVTPP